LTPEERAELEAPHGIPTKLAYGYALNIAEQLNVFKIMSGPGADNKVEQAAQDAASATDASSPAGEASSGAASSPAVRNEADKKGGIDGSTRPERSRMGTLTIDSTDTENKGGIDFRALPMVTQPMITPAGAPRINTDSAIRSGLPSVAVPAAELDNEWQEIQKMLNAGITPSSERIKEYLQGRCGNGNFEKEIDKVLSCIADILRIEEDRVVATEPALREFLVLLESDKTADQFRVALAEIDIAPKEPKKVE